MDGRISMNSPIGWLTLSEKDTSLARLDFGRIGKETPGSGLLTEAARQLEEYFAGSRTAFDLPLAPEGTPFQQKVWQALRAIPYGKTSSYADIARAAGCPKGFRAVGMANNRNPIPIIIPCHRVIGSDGSLTGYAGGLPAKRFLLSLEGAIR